MYARRKGPPLVVHEGQESLWGIAIRMVSKNPASQSSSTTTLGHGLPATHSSRSLPHHSLPFNLLRDPREECDGHSSGRPRIVPGKQVHPFNSGTSSYQIFRLRIFRVGT